jgi:hypothetical protein
MYILKSISATNITIFTPESNWEIGFGEFFWLNNYLVQVVELSYETIIFKIVKASVEILKTGQMVELIKLNLEIDFIPDLVNNMSINIDHKHLSTLQKQHDFIPVVQNGDAVKLQQKIGYISLSSDFKYWVLTPVEGVVNDIKIGTYSKGEVICKIDNQFICLFNGNISDLHTPKFTFYPTELVALDIFYPITSNSKTLLVNPPIGLIKDLLDPLPKARGRIILNLTNTPVETTISSQVINVFCGIDETEIIQDFVQNWCEAINSMGYQVLVVNRLSCFLSLKEVTIIEVAEQDNCLDYYDNKIVWQDKDILWSDSYGIGYNIETQNTLLENFNIEKANLYQKLKKLDFSKLPPEVQKLANYPQINTVDKIISIINGLV